MLTILQECLEYIEHQFKYMQNLNVVTTDLQQRYEMLHNKITSEILKLMDQTHLLQPSCSKPINEKVNPMHGVVIPENKEQKRNNTTLKEQSSLIRDTTLPNCDEYVDSDNGNEICNETFHNDTSTMEAVDNRLPLHSMWNTTLVDDNQTCPVLPMTMYDCDKEIEGQTCERKFLQKHMLLHAKERLFKCEVCKKQFSYKGNMKKHMLIHTGEYPLECSICNAKISDTSHMKRHMVIHTGDKQFECEICGKKFTLKSNMNVHMLTHTGIRQFQCEICKKDFTLKSNLKQHMLIHTGEKPFECEICQRKFSAKSVLKQHMVTHTGEKPFECEICKKKCSQKSGLNKHMLTHTGEKPFECEICKKKFSQKGNMKQHMSIHKYAGIVNITI